MKAIIFDWIGTLYDREEGVLPWAYDVLMETEFKKYKIGLISIAYENEERMNEINKSGLTHFFDKIIIDDKKSEKQYLECISFLGSTPEETYIVDDRTIRGIAIGNKLGCKTIWIQRGQYATELPDEKTGEPTYKVEFIGEILGWL